MTHYETLGVAKTATPEEIKASYRKLAKTYHPDLGGDVSKFQAISEAYETLSDADKRAHYDYQQSTPNGPQGFHFSSNFNHPNADFINEQFSQMFGFNFRNAQQVPRNRNIRIQLQLDFLDTLERVLSRRQGIREEKSGGPVPGGVAK